jgi:methionine sulfoxide reductase heme-binding subunit
VIAGVLGTKSLWYLARGTGVVSLTLLTAIVALGIGARSGAGASRIPRFAVTLLHRNLSLLVLVFLGVHIATSVLDPFAAIAWTDAVIPLSASYRPLWLGLGAVSFDLLLALAITSLLRVRLGLRTWRSIHWLAYACWPVALVHGLGTGSDVRSPWMLWLVAGSVATVVAAVCVRLATTSSVDLPWRVVMGAAVLIAPLLLAGWVQSGPLQPGWAGQAGTPAPLLRPAAVPVGSGTAAVRLPQGRREAGG